MGKKNRKRAPAVTPPPRVRKASPLLPRGAKQKALLHSLRHRELTFAVGPAGTGKTYVSTRHACELFESCQVDKIIVTRPMVSAEEDIGHLPGELSEKFAPFFAPVREIMIEHMGRGAFEYALKSGQIELMPIGFLRGHTFKNCFVLLDEAQNLSHLQMKMFLTRIGDQAQVCISGDPAQTDLTDPQTSGLQAAVDRFRHLPEVEEVRFDRQDCVRSGLVRKILDEYAK